jgi:hypothetical protein
MKTKDGLTVYDLDPQASELWAVAGPEGYRISDIDPENLPDGFRWVSENEWQELQEGTEKQVNRTRWKVTSDTWYHHEYEIYPTREEAEERAAELQAALDEEIEAERRIDPASGNLEPLTAWQADRHFFVLPVEDEEEDVWWRSQRI